MPVTELADLAGEFGISDALIGAMCDLGIGHIALGRRLDTMSGGEVQRLRLAMRLAVNRAGSLFFILDEPAAGLHPADVDRLAHALDRALDGGRNTVVIVEHNVELIRSADWLLDFGPGSGPDGGKIVFAESPAKMRGMTTPTALALVNKVPSPKASKWNGEAARGSLSVRAHIERTSALLRNLISGDAPTMPDDDGVAEPVAILSDRGFEGHRTWEVAGLNFEIPKLLIDIQLPPIDDTIQQLVDTWRKYPSCWLAIQPFITEIEIWGEGSHRLQRAEWFLI